MGREATALLSTLLALVVFAVMPWVVNLFEDEEHRKAEEKEKKRGA